MDVSPAKRLEARRVMVYGLGSGRLGGNAGLLLLGMRWWGEDVDPATGVL